MKVRRVLTAPLYLIRYLVRRGPRETLAAVGKWLQGFSIYDSRPMVVDATTIARVDWSTRPERHLAAAGAEPPYEVAWITSPPSPSSGGHQNMWRFIRTLEEAGHRCTVYLHDWRGENLKPRAIKRLIEHSGGYAQLDAEWRLYDGSVDASTHAIFATAWETAYQAWLDPACAKRFYFVQDFEPWFYPAGTNRLLAEHTYRFGFHGLTAGRWLAQHLSAQYGMPCDPYDFAADTSLYRPLPDARRDGVFFYARPSTPRRGFEIGMAALEVLAHMRPDVTVHLAGASLAGIPVHFRHVNHGELPLGRLNQVYNQCGAALVLSFSNLSLLPLELLAAGVTPVVNRAPHNELVAANPHIEYADPAPRAIAEALASALDLASAVHAQELAASVSNWSWTDSGAQFVAAFERSMHG